MRSLTSFFRGVFRQESGDVIHIPIRVSQYDALPSGFWLEQAVGGLSGKKESDTKGHS